MFQTHGVFNSATRISKESIRKVVEKAGLTKPTNKRRHTFPGTTTRTLSQNSKACSYRIIFYYIHTIFFSLVSDENINVTHIAFYQCVNQALIIACNKHFIAWFSRSYDPFSLCQKISLTRSFHSLVRDIFFNRENVSYVLTTCAIILS